MESANALNVTLVLFTIVKAITILLGFGLVIKNLIDSVGKKVPVSKAKALKMLLLTALIIVILTAIELFITFMITA